MLAKANATRGERASVPARPAMNSERMRRKGALAAACILLLRSGPLDNGELCVGWDDSQQS